MRRSKENVDKLKRKARHMKDDFKDDVREEWSAWKDRKASTATSRDHSRSRFYLDKRRGRFLGVCAGIADYTGIGATWVRLAFIAAFFFGVPFIIIGYFIAAFVAETKPREFEEEAPREQEFWRNVRTRPHTTVRDVRLRFKEMERRLRDMERYVTSKSRRLDREINALGD